MCSIDALAQEGSALNVVVWRQVLERLPVVDIRWRQPHLVQAKPRGLEGGTPPGQEYQVEVQLRRVGGKKSGSGLARVYAPRFPKVCNVASLASHKLLCVTGITGNPKLAAAGKTISRTCQPMICLPHLFALHGAAMTEGQRSLVSRCQLMPQPNTRDSLVYKAWHLLEEDHHLEESIGQAVVQGKAVVAQRPCKTYLEHET